MSTWCCRPWPRTPAASSPDRARGASELTLTPRSAPRPPQIDAAPRHIFHGRWLQGPFPRLRHDVCVSAESSSLQEPFLNEAEVRSRQPRVRILPGFPEACRLAPAALARHLGILPFYSVTMTMTT